jgi:hypothetical protein
VNKRFFFAVAAFLLNSAMLGGCANFDKLEEDLKSLDQNRVQIYGRVHDESASGSYLIAVYTGDADGSDIIDIRTMPIPGEFEMWLERKDGWLFVFADINNDNAFQESEPFGWYNDGQSVDPQIEPKSILEVTVKPAGSGQSRIPSGLMGQSVYRSLEANRGVIADIWEERFSHENAENGLWEPYSTFKEGSAGLFFLEPYDEDRIPVLLVHGIMGTPRDFASLIHPDDDDPVAIDPERFQTWFLNYPSGFELSTLGYGLYHIMEELRKKYGFKQAHVIAHSMGGLVSRWYIKSCVEQTNGCSYLSTFTTIASPLGGVKSSEMGVEYAPTVVPVWNDLAPSSKFLEDLYATELPDSINYSLMFAYGGTGMMSTQCSDGRIVMTSQLRWEAQKEASNKMGFDQTHVGVLSDPQFLQVINEILTAE